MRKNNYKIIDIKNLIKAEWNYKKEDAELSKKLKANILKNGQIENIIVRELSDGLYEIVNGNHRYDVFIDPEVDIKKVMCYNLGKISQKEAEVIGLETNETKFPIDVNKLTAIFKELTESYNSEFLSSTINYEKEYIELITDKVKHNDIEVHEQQPTEIDDDIPIYNDDIDKLSNKERIDNFFLKVGNMVNEMIEHEDYDQLCGALDKIKSNTKSNSYVKSIIEVAEEL